MPWTRIDDGWASNRKILRAGPEAAGFWVALCCYCNRNLTDGHVPKDELSQIWSGMNSRRTTRLIGELIATGLVNDLGNTFEVNDYLDYNKPRARILEERRKEKEKKARQRKTKAVSPQGTEILVPQGVPKARPDPTQLNPPVPSARPPQGGDSGAGFHLEVVEKPEVQEAAKVSDVFECWRRHHGSAAMRLTAKREKRIRARLREGVSVDEMKAAIRGALADPWLMGVSKRSKRPFRGVDTILRDADQVANLARLDGKPKALKRGVAPVGDFSGVKESGLEQLERMMAQERRRRESGD